MQATTNLSRYQMRAKSEITVQLLNAKHKLTREQYVDLIRTVGDYCRMELEELAAQETVGLGCSELVAS